VLQLRTVDGQYGLSTLVKLVTDEGNLLSWFASGSVDEDVCVGDRVTVVGTIKRRSEYRGTRETQLTRVVLTRVAEAA